MITPNTQQKLKETRKVMFEQMEKRLQESMTPEDSLFYYHQSDDRIVLSHALFWVMTGPMSGKIAKEKLPASQTVSGRDA